MTYRELPSSLATSCNSAQCLAESLPLLVLHYFACSALGHGADSVISSYSGQTCTGRPWPTWASWTCELTSSESIIWRVQFDEQNRPFASPDADRALHVH